MNFNESKTLNCLVNAFAGESQSKNRYTFFGKVAKTEGYEKISQVFMETALNEEEHAKLFYRHIPNGHHKVLSEYPFSFGNTYENLISAMSGEREEWETIYENASLIAKDEGFEDISKLFGYILEIEKRHSHRFEKLANMLKEGNFFKKDENTQWVCLKCGHTHIGKEAPCQCPVCGHPQGYFTLLDTTIS